MATISNNSPVTIGLVLSVLGVQAWVLKEVYATRDAMGERFVSKDLFAARMDDVQHQLDAIQNRLRNLEMK